MTRPDSFTTMSAHLGSDARLVCHTYPDTAPIVSLDAPGWSLMISTTGRTGLGESDVANARRLAQVVATYVAEVERLAAPTGQPSENTATEAA